MLQPGRGRGREGGEGVEESKRKTRAAAVRTGGAPLGPQLPDPWAHAGNPELPLLDSRFKVVMVQEKYTLVLRVLLERNGKAVCNVDCKSSGRASKNSLSQRLVSREPPASYALSTPSLFNSRSNVGCDSSESALQQKPDPNSISARIWWWRFFVRHVLSVHPPLPLCVSPRRTPTTLFLVSFATRL